MDKRFFAAIGLSLAAWLAAPALRPAASEAPPAQPAASDAPTQQQAPQQQSQPQQPARPAQRVVVIDTQGAPALGPENAPVTIVEFGDFQCPYCAKGAKGLRRLMTMYPGQVRWVFKHYPLRTMHPQAALAHEAAVAAQDQGKFWEMHELLLANQSHFKYQDLVGYAEQLGLDMVAFKDALDTRRLRPRVIRDMEEARKLPVVATPTYYINGVRYMGARTANGFRMLVAPILKGLPAPPADDAPAEDDPASKDEPAAAEGQPAPATPPSGATK